MTRLCLLCADASSSRHGSWTLALNEASVIKIDPDEYQQTHARIQHTDAPLPVHSRFLQSQPPTPPAATGAPVCCLNALFDKEVI